MDGQNNGYVIPPEPAPKRSNVLGIISMILGIAGAASFFFGLPFGLAATILAAADRRRWGTFSPMSRTGFICGLIMTILWAALFAAAIILGF